jgi:hypothetical protein
MMGINGRASVPETIAYWTPRPGEVDSVDSVVQLRADTLCGNADGWLATIQRFVRDGQVHLDVHLNEWYERLRPNWRSEVIFMEELLPFEVGKVVTCTLKHVTVMGYRDHNGYHSGSSRWDIVEVEASPLVGATIHTTHPEVKTRQMLGVR